MCSGASSAQLHLLVPLTDGESLEVLRDLLPKCKLDHAFLSHSVARAGGNPYYLHAIAQSGTEGNGQPAVPFDVRSFAAASYLSLGTDARMLFESCLLLGRFANLKRVREIASVDGPPLLAALRALEDQGLITFSNGELRCAHALLEEAVRSLIPSAVEAALSERIAKCLERECASQGYAAPIAAAAASSWIAAGDISAASRLLQHCAVHAAALGEPRLAADTLLQIPRQQLGPSERVAVISSIVDYAEAAGSRELVCLALRDLQRTKLELPTSPEDLREIAFRVLEADLRFGVDPASAITPLVALVADAGAPTPIRVRAGVRLLIAADMNLDAKLADCVMRWVGAAASSLPREDPLSLRIELIYDTVFGDQKRAAEIASTLLCAHPFPSLTQAAVAARRNAAVALSRIGFSSQAAPILAADYRFMSAHRVASEAAYCALLLGDASLSGGDLRAATSWLHEASVLMNNEPQAQALQAGYHYAVASLAVSVGNCEEAHRLVDLARIHYPAIGVRYQAVALSLRLKVRALAGKNVHSDPEVSILETLFQQGAKLGAQDAIVEALWLVYHVNDPERASVFLTDYLRNQRRELGEPESSLRLTTSGDRAWRDCSAAT